MDAFILIEAEKLKLIVGNLGRFYGKMTGFISDKIFDLIRKEVFLAIESLGVDQPITSDKKTKLNRALYKINGIRNTIQFLEIEKGTELNDFTSGLCENLRLIEEKIIRIILLL